MFLGKFQNYKFHSFLNRGTTKVLGETQCLIFLKLLLHPTSVQQLKKYQTGVPQASAGPLVAP